MGTETKSRINKLDAFHRKKNKTIGKGHKHIQSNYPTSHSLKKRQEIPHLHFRQRKPLTPCWTSIPKDEMPTKL